MQVKIVTFLILSGLLPHLNFGQHPVLVSDFYEGSGDGVGFYNISDYKIATSIVLDDQIFLPLYSEETGIELGILKNGELNILKDIFPGDKSSSPVGFFTYKNKVYFQVHPNLDPFRMNATELWVTDGTEEGTELILKDNSSSGGRFFHIISDQGILYFLLNERLYKYDGENLILIERDIIIDYSTSDRVNHPLSKYKGEVVFIDFTGSLYQTNEDQVKLLQKIDNYRDGASYSFGLNPVKEGIMFAIRNHINSSIEYLHLFSEKDSAIYKITTPISKQPRSLVGIGSSYVLSESSDGLYTFSGIEDAPKKIYSTNDTYTIADQRVHFYLDEDKILYIIHKTNPNYNLIFLQTDTTFQDVNVLLEIPNLLPNNLSNGIIHNKHLYILKGNGIQLQYEPEIYEIDLETGSARVIYQFEDLSGNSIDHYYIFDLISIIDNKLYFTANFDKTVGNELYYLDLSTLVSNEEVTSERNSFIRTLGNGFKIEAPESAPVDVDIYNTEGRIVKRISTYTNTLCELDLPMGIYIINTSVNSVKLSNKILIR